MKDHETLISKRVKTRKKHAKNAQKTHNKGSENILRMVTNSNISFQFP